MSFGLPALPPLHNRPSLLSLLFLSSSPSSFLPPHFSPPFLSPLYISLFLLHLPYSPLLSTFLSSAALLLGLWPVPSGAEYPSGFRGCLPGVSQLLRRGEEGGAGLHGPLVHERGGGSTMDSASPGPEAPARRGPCAPPVWAPAPAPGGSRSPPPRRLLSGGLPGASTSIPAPQSTSRRFAESPGPGLRLWRPW